MKLNKTILWNRLIYAGYITVITIIALEILLRFFYPFQKTIAGGKWQLSTNITYQLRNIKNQRVDPMVINKRNSIGFRGENPAGDMNARFTLLTVGGSTTACTALDEGKTWTDRLGRHLNKTFTSVWINNAGLDGNSTYGHIKLISNYLSVLPFKPKVIVFLIGVNDIDRDDISLEDAPETKGFAKKNMQWLENKSATVHFFRDLERSLYPIEIFKNNGNWNFTNFKAVYLSQSYMDSAITKQDSLLQAFKKRLYHLTAACYKMNILPVFVTQPLVFGNGTLHGGNPAIDFHVFNNDENGQLFWKKLTLFNDVTTKVSQEEKIHCIDLATLMPKDTLYYYDSMHYTNEGAEKVSRIIYEDLNQYLSEKFPQYLIP
ncbi:MAG: SGNH/GDSL hydrolase family protein [Chitinophagaceae bacterium]